MTIEHLTVDDLPTIETYEWNPETRELEETEKRPTAFVDKDGLLCVSGEDGSGFVDYYGEYRGGVPYIHPDLEKWAEDHGGYWEWANPGAIVLVD